MAEMKFILDLFYYWDKNKVKYERTSGTENAHNLVSLELPKDFQLLYQNFNGMIDCDQNGFLFLKPQKIITMGQKFSLEEEDTFYDVLLFIDYMQASWWYGLKLYEKSYEIGIVANEKRFKPITNSLDTFINLYIEDSVILYDYGGY